MSDDANGTPMHEGKPPARVCGAKNKRTGLPCQSTAIMPNGRCRMHGGLSLSGPDLPQFKHGLYSKVFPKDMRAAYRRVREHPETMSLSAETEALTVKMQTVFAKMDETDAPPWGDAVESWNDVRLALNAKNPDKEQLDAAVKRHDEKIRQGVGAEVSQARLWREFRELAQEKASLVKNERDWLAKLRSMFTAEQGLMFQMAIMEAARRRFGDRPEDLAGFLEDALRLLDDPNKPKQPKQVGAE